MPITVFSSAQDFFAALPAHGRIVGLDFGTKTIGLATSDMLQGLASPAKTIKRKKLKDDVAELADFIDKEEICGMVMGLPRNMDGSEGPRAQSTRAFVRNITAHFNLPLLFWDERLSTVAAERAMLEQDMSRAKRADKIDAHAAAFILQGALDAKGFAK